MTDPQLLAVKDTLDRIWAELPLMRQARLLFHEQGLDPAFQALMNVDALLIAQAAHLKELEQENKELLARVAPLNDCVDGQGLPQSGNREQSSLRDRTVALAMWALVDHLKAIGEPFDTWPDRVKLAFSEAILDHRPPTEAEIARTHELAATFGWEQGEDSQGGHYEDVGLVDDPSVPNGEDSGRFVSQETGHPPARCVAVDPVVGAGTDGLRAQILDLQTQLITQAAHLERVHQEHEELKKEHQELQSRVAPPVDCVAPIGSTAEPSPGAVTAAETCPNCGLTRRLAAEQRAWKDYVGEP